MAVTEADVLRALSAVRDPTTGADLVSRQLVRNVKICEGNIAFDLVPPGPAPQLREQLECACRQAVQALPGVRAVNVRVGTAAVPAGAAGVSDLLPGVRSVIAVGSGKGGVGKSTVATNLAAALAAGGARVGLLDADIYGPSVPVMMGVRRTPHVEDGKMLPVERHGVQLMSLGFVLPDSAAPVVWRGPMVGQAVRQLLADVRWGELDYLLVDLPPGTGDAQLTLAQTVPLTGAVIVMTSQDVAVQIASKALGMFQKLNVPVIGIVENMSAFACPHCGEETPIFTHGGSEGAAERLGVPFLGSIPLDPAVVRHGDEGTPTVVAAPDSAQAEAFRRVADALAARVEALRQEAAGAEGAPPNPLGNLMQRLQQR